MSLGDRLGEFIVMIPLFNVYNAFLLLYIIVIAISIYGFCWSDIGDNGLNGLLSRFLFVFVPEKASRALLALCGPRTHMCCSDAFIYVTKERNPLMQIVYLVVINLAYISWMIYGEHLLPSHFVPLYHKYIAMFGIVACHVSFYYACKVGPGTITKETVRYYDYEPFDNVLFVDDNMCQSCDVLKPARSKHCSLCDKCVPSFDHHCVWLNQVCTAHPPTRPRI